VTEALKANPGYDLQLVGHSMGGGVAALAAYALRTDAALAARLGEGVGVTAVGISTAACMTPELAAKVAPFVTTLVMRYDLVPRFSTASVVALKEELLATQYKELLLEDLAAWEVCGRSVGGFFGGGSVCVCVRVCVFLCVVVVECWEEGAPPKPLTCVR
jgi:predicted alpha/beta hydrolase